MGFLLRRSWSNPNGGANPELWEKPVNQASKWLCQYSGSYRILSEGGSVTIADNNDAERSFAISAFVGDGGSVNVGGTSGNSTIQISRAGSTLTVTARTSGGTAGTATFETTMPSDRWSNIYIRTYTNGINGIRVTAMCDFNESKQVVATSGSIFTRDQISVKGKTLTCVMPSGWAWFGGTTGGLWGWGSTSKVPITDVKYREAFLSNGTWDIDNDTSNHTNVRPDGLRYSRQWLIQGGGGQGGNGGDGGDGARGSDGASWQPDRCEWGSSGGSGGSGGDGGRGGNNGANGSSGGSGSSGWGGSSPSYRYGETGDDPNKITSCTGGSGGQGGSGGKGGTGGLGGRGVMTLSAIAQASTSCRAGVAGARGSSGSNGSSGSGNGGNGSSGSNGGPGGDGGHTTFGGVSTAGSTTLSTPTIKFGVTEFEHFLGGPGQPGGVVFYYQW